MQIVKTQPTSQNTLRNSVLTAGVGAAAGVAGAYIIPERAAMKNIINKDTFVSSVKSNAQNRSIIKYAGLGALVALGLGLAKKIFSSPKEDTGRIQYSKYDALLDASDYACMVTWYNDNLD